MTMIRILHARLKAFAEDARGSLSVEAALILPLLCWFYVSAFVWFDAYRTQNANLKASYTLADMLSRETDPVTETYLKGLNKVYDYLTTTRHPTYLRVTVVKCTNNCDEESRTLQIDWSYATEGRPKHTNGTIAGMKDKIPLMPQGDTVILLETFMAYEPLFNAGIPAKSFENYIVTRPRFAPQLLYAGAGS
ncbi:TadE/TadG family type IV pilus assembly protein [Vannielia litorea]|uniref:TadE/TadG family type IV pilus assembly protein n=1 Tax=Vannielia TaxID=2813041 RepID=UPI001C9681A8|nr:pilus assembly protein [Vannielia litorea]MBY6047776.1 pilus assembly protein [Vannielia litorea]MBY6075190.1 pilus assembly protein [Vannielia litorea]